MICTIVSKGNISIKKEWDWEVIPNPTLFHSKIVNNSHGTQSKIAW